MLSYSHLSNDLLRMTGAKIFPFFEEKILFEKLSFYHESFSSGLFLAELAKKRLKSPFAQSVISQRKN